MEDTPLVKHMDPTVYPATVNPRDNFGPFLVPQGSFFMLGDNRDNSVDSRFWKAVPRRLLKGKAMFVYWSKRPSGAIRWTRLLASVR